MPRSNPELENLRRELQVTKAALARVRTDPGDRPFTGCGDNSCILVKPTGMATNGGCRCAPFALRQAVVYWRALAEFRLTQIQALRDGEPEADGE